MNTESLKTFITLARCNSFTKTAQELLVVQSTISSRIKELEAQIGQKLFTRSKNNVVMTPAGEMFLAYAVSIVEMEEAAITKINMSKVKYAETLAVGCSHTLFDCYILDRSIRYMQENADVSLKLNIAHSSEIISSLGANNLDVAYTYWPFHHARYVCRPFINERLILVTRARNVKYLGGITKEELLDVRLISSDITLGNSPEWMVPIQKIYPLDVNIIAKIVPFLKNGEWYCFLPMGLVQKELDEGSLVEIPLKGMKALEKQSYIIFKRDYKKYAALTKWMEM